MAEAGYLRHARSVRDEVIPDSAPGGDAIGHVMLVLSASRGGSSLLYEVLSTSPDLLCLAGEHVPFYKLHGFDRRLSPDGSDRIDFAEAQQLQELGRTIVAEARLGGKPGDPTEPGFARLLALRLTMQWPGLGLTAGDLATLIDDAVDRHGEHHPPALIAKIGQNAGYYDRLDAPRPSGPPNPRYCLEEPPFVVPVPRKLPTAADLARKPLLLKAPLDAYRLGLLRQVFPNARFTAVHMTRSPAASINGLYDGWLDRGFFSHRLTEGLAIPGYSDIADWATQWWNFDLPPGWQEYTARPLAEVCAFQWRSVHEHILREHRFEANVRVRFEDLIANRAKVIDTIRLAAGLPLAGHDDTPLPNVMATRPPAKDRWLARADMVGPAAALPDVASIADALGYQQVAA